MKFTKEEKMDFVKRYQEGETVIQICNEDHIPAVPSIAGYKNINKQ